MRLSRRFPPVSNLRRSLTRRLRVRSRNICVLRRDEGAKITAEAFAEAEKLEKENAVPAAAAKYDAIRDAVNDIAGKDSQATILKALVDNAAEFAPRGAFFIIKSEQFTGWKVFGDDTHAAEAAIREISFPMSADTVVGASVRSMTTIDSAAGAHPEDTAFLDDLGFGRPDRMYAIPLVARGKAVAVLYADFGNDGTHLQLAGSRDARSRCRYDSRVDRCSTSET